ncbi:SigE family RNA polymerase sigma factor [Nocardioides sp. R-C-SC26]|uniref:SigE family RNA polymerase sigma factor n=1 Tax=Nocardioides sp. R-C-SC26 TaxID=2870414 RepID=UPI001E2A59B7|nr:SigE family RNA polymerase sigma factor [Nocardioides sp. R-C-SC26]
MIRASRPPSDAEFASLVEAVWPRLYRTAYLLIGDAGEAEDLVQTALAKTYASWGRVRSVDAAPGYAHTTLVNTARSWFRTKRWRNERPTEALPEPTSASDDIDPSLRPTLLAALAALPPRQRAVVVLRFYEDHSVAETAHLLGVTDGTVKSQTSAALTTLRGLLGDDLLIDSDATTGAHHD